MAGCIFLVLVLYWTTPSLRENFWSGVFVEFNGMMFDIVVFGVLIAIYARLTERRREAQRQQEIIDDFKKWNSDEARFRIAGSVRRLIRMGKTGIDFGGIELRDFSFRAHDIESIRGAVFYDGTWGTLGSRDRVELEKVDFSNVDCRDVIFSGFNPFTGLGFIEKPAVFRDCLFVNANLDRAVFDGSTLEWTDDHPEDLGVEDYTDEAAPFFEQTHWPAFDNADLGETSFRDTDLRNADFRNAYNVIVCNFQGAKGLNTCLFDSEETKELVIARAAGQTSSVFGPDSSGEESTS